LKPQIFFIAPEDKKYPREVLIFNMCFIVAKRTQGDWVFEPLVQKCAEYLVELEKVGFWVPISRKCFFPENVFLINFFRCPIPGTRLPLGGEAQVAHVDAPNIRRTQQERCEA
jgi:hypothetical protein